MSTDRCYRLVFCAALVPIVTGYSTGREPQPQPTPSPSTTATPVVAQVIDPADLLVNIEEARPQIVLKIGFGDEECVQVIDDVAERDYAIMCLRKNFEHNCTVMTREPQVQPRSAITHSPQLSSPRTLLTAYCRVYPEFAVAIR